jgi:hypothetical protein
MEAKNLADLDQLFKEGNDAMALKHYFDAKSIYEKILEENPTCDETWNNLGVALCELFKFRDSLKAYNIIDESRRTTQTWYNVALAYYYSSEYDQALESVQKCIEKDNDNFRAFDLKGKIQIEQEDYQNALESFNQAFTVSGDPKFLLWEAYAFHLLCEFSGEIDEQTHKRSLHLLIRRLERLKRLAQKANVKAVHEQTLYFLGCCYSRYKDYLTAVDKLDECLGVSSKSEVTQAARNLLEQIWNYQVRPPWWRWWWQSPSFLGGSAKRYIFGITFISLLLIITLFLFHPFLELQAEWGLYLFVVGLLLFILVSPSVEQIKTKDMEIKMHGPPPLDLFPSPARMEDQIGSMREAKSGKKNDEAPGIII